MRRMSLHIVGGLAVGPAFAIVVAGCVGQLGANESSAGDGTGGDNMGGRATRGPAGAGGSTAGPNDPRPGAAVAGQSPFRRLTLRELSNAVKDLVGDAPFVVDLEEVRAERENEGEYTTQAASRESFEAADFEDVMKLALASSRAVFASETRRMGLVGCAPASAADPCVRRFVESFGRRAFRRPLTDAEIDRYIKVAAAAPALGADVWTGLEHVVAAAIVSPNFLYVPAFGEADPQRPGVRRHTGFEIATRLALALTGSIPDNELLDAAARGDLATAAGVRAQARRLLGKRDQLERGIVQGFFAEYFELEGLAGLTKDPKLYPQATTALGTAMRQEIEKSMGDVVSLNLPFARVFSRRETYLNADLAKLYGLAAPTSKTMTKTVLPADGERMGLLGFGGFLALNAGPKNSAPPNRGKFVRQRLLCQAISPPPPDVDTTAADLGLPAVRTKRTEAEARAKLSQCAGCHAFIDPPGLALEAFDAIGAFRTNDRGLPLDLRGSLDGVTFEGLSGLAGALEKHAAPAGCLLRQFYRFATGAKEDDAREEAITALAKDPAAAAGTAAAVIELVASELFRSFSDAGRTP